jgi:hypothetical protein
MNRQFCLSLFMAVVFTWGSLCSFEAAAQVACPTAAPVVAYQPVVVPTSPALISGWYPGKLLDTWAANRAAYRATAVEAATTAYRPTVLTTTAVPVTSYYRPLATVSYQTTYLPVRTYRPLFAEPLVATTTYSPVVTAYAPVVSTATVCCDACGMATVTGYASTTSACCGATVSSAPYDGGIVTPIPQINSDQPYDANRPTGANGSGNAGAGGEPEQPNPAANPNEGGNTGADRAAFEPPALYDPRMQAPPAKPDNPDPVVRAERMPVTPAVYNEPVRPSLVSQPQGAAASKQPSKKPLPSRAERDAGWKPLHD